MTVTELRLVKSQRDQITDAVMMTLSVACAYYVANPDAFERHLQLVRDGINRVKHAVSIWQALGEIQSLPETREPQM